MNLRLAVDAALFAAAAVPALWGTWWTLLALLALRRPLAPMPARQRLSMTVVIPAHNEEGTVARCLRSLLASELPPSEIVVVADNCTDATAAVARDFGVTVLVRDDSTLRGKSHALDFALAALRDRPQPPAAVLFIDADTEVAPDCLTHLEARLDTGARVVQAYYQAAATTSELGRLRRLAFALVHWTRPLGAARLGLGATLKGNGMAFRWDVVASGTGGRGVTEDAAMTLSLVARGVPVAFEPSARVFGLMADDYAGARTQDERWEGGRAHLLAPAIRGALRAARTGNLSGAAAALEVAAPPLSLLGTLAMAALGGAVVTRSGALSLALIAVGSLGAYVFVGLISARVSFADLLAARGIPRFVAHKLAIYVRLLRRGVPTEWERTQREAGQ